MFSAMSAIEAVLASRIFDVASYSNEVSRTFQAAAEAVADYIARGERAGASPNPLFQPGYYAQQAGVTAERECLLLHYLRIGWAAGLRTHPLFDTAFYLAHNPDVVEAGINPLAHFLASGGTEGRRPHPLFHSFDYVSQVPLLRETRQNPLVHYLQQGWRQGFEPHSLFNGDFYLRSYPEVAQAGMNPLLHFVVHGLAEGRAPNYRFSPAMFRESGADAGRLSSETPIANASGWPRTVEEDYHALRVEMGRLRAHRPLSDDPSPVRTIAFYLPQFHPIPENDANWGVGFTEWTGVRGAKPNFLDHDQPRVPADLGYYDLRDGQVLERQADLAKSHGVSGFCFYWYWFNGRKPLELPLLQMLESGRPDFPFCLCWANEGWTRKWAGGEDVILGHDYSDEDDRRHVAELTRYMSDSRYIRTNGAPMLLIYRGGGLPNPPQYLAHLRQLFATAGIPQVHFAAVESAELAWAHRDPRELGFDSAVEFPPHGGSGQLNKPLTMINQAFSGAMFDYRETAVRYATAPLPAYPRSRSVMMGWDNTARYQDSPAIFVNATPGGYRAWLESAIADVKATRRGEDRMVFINAWNEWGEGTYLEPDARWGLGYLEATRSAVSASRESQPLPMIHL